MKNLSLAINGVLAIAVAILFYLHFSAPVSSNTTVTVNTDDAPTGEQIRYVNSDSLLNNFVFYKNLRETAEAKRGKVEKDFINKKQSFEQEVMAYQQAAATMSDLQRQTKEQQLGKKQQELAVYEQKQTDTILKAEQKATDELFKKINDYLKVYSQKSGVKVVLAYTRGSGILYASDSLDITKEVIEGLNKEYAK